MEPSFTGGDTPLSAFPTFRVSLRQEMLMRSTEIREARDILAKITNGSAIFF